MSSDSDNTSTLRDYCFIVVVLIVVHAERFDIIIHNYKKIYNI